MLDPQSDSGAERVADDEQRRITDVLGEHVEPGDGIQPLLGEVAALAARAGPEVEAQGGDPDLRQRPEQRGDDGVEPVSAEARVRVEEHGAGAWVRRDDQVGGQAEAVGGQHGGRSGSGVHRGGRYSHDVVSSPDDKLPIKMLNDRLLVRIPDKDGERRTQGGILIPATAQMAKRLVWAEVVALGQNVRSAEVGDLVLFSPEDRYEVEVQGSDYIMLRERDIHAVAAERIEAATGLYL